MSEKILIFNHGGSKNHGCEALVRTIARLLPNDSFVTLLSDAPEEDFSYGIDEIVDEILPSVQSYSKFSLSFLHAYLTLKTKNDYTPMDLLPYKAAIQKLPDDYDIAVSIGGDVYCYDNYPMYIGIHRLIRKKAKKTYLIGCSLEESLFADPEMIDDLNSYTFITARETLTYELLKKNEINHVSYIPDSAFTLQKQICKLPDIVKGSIGINVSPLVSKRGADSSIVYENYSFLIKRILEETNYYVTLIPHVVWESNDDRQVLKQLYEEFSDTGRIILIEDHNCMELKYIISQCRFFVGARTHATIAAYSSGVPTLVVGYSITSRGIAKDLFSTDEGYVIPVQGLLQKEDLWNTYRKMAGNKTLGAPAIDIEKYKSNIHFDSIF